MRIFNYLTWLNVSSYFHFFYLIFCAIQSQHMYTKTFDVTLLNSNQTYTPKNNIMYDFLRKRIQSIIIFLQCIIVNSSENTYNLLNIAKLKSSPT